MKLKTLDIKNFLGIGDAKIDFAALHGLTLIEGENADSLTASSNGAGKSCIFESLFWVLFGKTKRGLSGDDVVNRTAGKGCVVTLSFEADGGIFVVQRTRKESGLTVMGIEPVTGATNNLTKGTIKDTQDLIETIIGMSELTFSKVTHFGQGDVKDFAALSDAELKQVFEQALGLSFFSENLSKVKVEKVNLQSAVSRLEDVIETDERTRGFLTEKIDTLTTVKGDLKNKAKAEIERLTTDLKEAQERADSMEMELLGRRDVLSKDAVAVKAMADSYKDIVSARTAASAALDIARGDAKHAEINAKNGLAAFTALTKSKAEAEGKVGDECGECGREYTPADIKKLSDQIDKNIEESKANLGLLGSIHKGAATALAKAEEDFANADIKYEDVRSIEAKLVGINAEKSALANMESEIENLKRRITGINAAIEAVKTTDTSASYDSQIKDSKDGIKKVNAEIAANGVELAVKKDTVGVVEMLDDILGNSGLKSYIFDNITPELNRVVAEYMNVLNPDIKVEISTLTKLKSGDYRDKFSISVDMENGAGEYKGNSGGERQLVNLAIALGFNSLCRSMTTGSINVLFLDEPFESLDEAAAERAVDLCHTFSTKVDVPCIITHNQSVKDSVVNRIKVRKSGGKAVISV